MTPETFSGALEQFVRTAQEQSDAHFARSFPTLTPPVFTVERGRRYVRIVRNDTTCSRSVHVFVDSANGDILKADSWKGPAKGARGNIFAGCPFERVTADGVRPHGDVGRP